MQFFAYVRVPNVRPVSIFLSMVRRAILRLTRRLRELFLPGVAGLSQFVRCGRRTKNCDVPVRADRLIPSAFKASIPTLQDSKATPPGSGLLVRHH